MIQDSAFITSTKAARMLGITRQALYYMIKDNKINARRVETDTGTFFYVFKKDTIEKLINRRGGIGSLVSLQKKAKMLK